MSEPHDVSEVVTPRILAIMGSGETAPTMAKVHRQLFGRLGRPPVPAVLLDTPYGFQENADEITERALDYFRDNVGYPMTPATFRSQEVDPLERATAVAHARAARYLFAGPGSPSYALAQWQGTDVPTIVADKLRDGGIVTFASAAALTLGSHTVPVYEIYKVGEAPRWLPGLDLLTVHGLRVAVIPHYDNAEGGTHDTRYCYLGERRLAMLESGLPAGHFVLGVDSHTALVLDLGEGVATVLGVGSVTVRAGGRSVVFETGSSMPISALAEAAAQVRERGHDVGGGASSAAGLRAGEGSPVVVAARSPLDAAVRDLATRFDEQLTAGRVEDAVRAMLAMDDLLLEWSRDTEGTGELDRARATYRSCIVRLGEHAATADRTASDDRLAPLVDLLVDLRDRARADRDWRRADWIRDALVDAGIEVRDDADATTWVDGRMPR